MTVRFGTVGVQMIDSRIKSEKSVRGSEPLFGAGGGCVICSHATGSTLLFIRWKITDYPTVRAR